MKIMSLAAALCATAVSFTAIAAQTPPPRHMTADANNDGVLTRAEFLNNAAARFASMDADRNGMLSDEERRAMRPHRGGMWGMRQPGAMQGPGAAPQAGAERSPLGGMGRMGGGRMLERFDADGDGRVSRAEYDGGTARLYERMADRGIDRADFAKRSGERFARMDANGDGYVDAAERAAMPAPPRPPIPGQTPPPPPPPGE